MPTVSPATLSAGLALVSAVAWGGADFAGGMGVKAVGGSSRGALRLVVAAHGVSLVALLALLGLQHAGIPGGTPMLWGLAAGVAGGLSLSAFYVALARGAMGASAAVSGLLAAAIPAVLSIWLDGAPGLLRTGGFLLAAAAIWMIAAGEASASETGSGVMGLAIGAGIGFGVYFVALRLANPLGVLWPTALARLASVVTCSTLLLGMSLRQSALQPAMAEARLGGKVWGWILGVAVLDTGANLLFVASTRSGRLDIAAVLGSLYPASTIALAAVLLRERMSRRQALGMGVAVAAVVLITV